MRPITLRVLCEGKTESNFVTQLLIPHLKSYNVFAKAEPLRPDRYGVVPWNLLRNAIKLDVGRSKPNEFVTTMVDLYKIGKYPAADKRPGERVIERVNRIETQMAEELPNPRFIPYVQVHEFEALVLVGLDRLSEQFPDGEAEGAAERLRASIGALNPEDVDDGEETAPSKRIIKEVPLYAELKSIAGPAIAASVGLAKLRKACPHFEQWIFRLESLSTD